MNVPAINNPKVISKCIAKITPKKIAITKWNENNVWSHFCSQGCWNNFMHEHWNEFIRLHPRTDCLETPIEIDVETRTDYFGNPYKQKAIREVDNA